VSQHKIQKFIIKMMTSTIMEIQAAASSLYQEHCVDGEQQ